MSIAELKERFRDIPGIENLTVRLEGGQQVFSLGGRFTVGLPPLATDAEIETALRAVVPALAPTSAALPIVTILQPIVTAASPATGAHMTNPVTAGLTVKEVMEGHAANMQQIMQAQVQLLKLAADRQALAVSTAVGSVADKINAQTDEFQAMMGQFTNGI